MNPLPTRSGLLVGLLLVLVTPCLLAAAPPLQLIKAAGPVELLRNGQRLALTLSMPIQVGDLITTSSDARATLRFDELILSLGGDSALSFVNSETLEGGLPVLRMQLDSGVLRVDGRAGRGAPQDLRLNAADLRLRVLGSDVWIAVDEAQRSVCLVDGAVELQSAQGLQRLDSAGDCLFADRDGVRVRRPSPSDLVGRLAMTDYPRSASSLPRGSAVSPAFAAATASPHAATALPTAAIVAPSVTAPAAPDLPLPPANDGPKTGGWTLVALALGDGESARLEALTFSEMGLPSQVRPYTPAGGRQLYRVTIGSFATRQQALAYSELLKARFGLNQLWAASY